MRYFVTIRALDDIGFADLGSFDLDLFVGSSKRRDRSVEGLLSLEQVGYLVDRGYEVLVEDAESARSRATDIVSFAEWRKSVS